MLMSTTQAAVVLLFNSGLHVCYVACHSSHIHASSQQSLHLVRPDLVLELSPGI